MSLYQDWLNAKEQERQAVDRRRVIEDELIASLHVDDSKDGSNTYKEDGYKVKVTTRLNRKVDPEALIDLAQSAGIGQEHLQALFRWKPELNLREWQNAAESITKPLEQAITTKPGRPSFNIAKEEA
jgi:DNA topoisomerase IB